MSVRWVPLLRTLLQGVHQAGRAIVQQRQSQDMGIVHKAQGAGPQTEADRQAQSIILHHIASSFPSLLASTIAEEGPLDLDILDSSTILQESRNQKDSGNLCENPPTPWGESSWMSRWSSLLPSQEQESGIKIFIDPLDGTKEYVRGSESVPTVMVGVCVDHRPYLGLIHQPFLGRWLLGIVDIGAFSLHLPLENSGAEQDFVRVPPCPVLPATPLCALTTKHHATPKMEALFHSLEIQEYLREGGAGYKMLRLLGVAPAPPGAPTPHIYAYPGPGMSLWDVCAPEACLLAMHGQITDIEGSPIDYRAPDASVPRGILATHPHCPTPHPVLLERMRGAFSSARS